MKDNDRVRSSGDLVREAREDVTRGMDLPDVDGLTDAGSGDDAPPSAEEIAAFLAETEEASAGDRADGETPESVVGVASLPSWAMDESAPAETPGAAADEAPSTIAVADGEESSEQGGHDRDIWATSSTEWEARPKREKKQGIPLAAFRPLAFILFLGFAAFGFISAQLDGNEAIDSIEVGSCFDAGDAVEIDRVPIIDCAEPHDSELFASVTIEGFGSAFPGDDALFEWLINECIDRFDAYVGEPYESSAFWIDPYIPTQSGWSEGDRTGLCSAVVVDDDFNVVPVTGSARASGGSA